MTCGGRTTVTRRAWNAALVPLVFETFVLALAGMAFANSMVKISHPPFGRVPGQLRLCSLLLAFPAFPHLSTFFRYFDPRSFLASLPFPLSKFVICPTLFALSPFSSPPLFSTLVHKRSVHRRLLFRTLPIISVRRTYPRPRSELGHLHRFSFTPPPILCP